MIQSHVSFTTHANVFKLRNTC